MGGVCSPGTVFEQLGVNGEGYLDVVLAFLSTD